jgi:PDZ domain-containing protein
MQRRGVTVLVGAVVVLVLAVGALYAAPVPYVVLDPGPTVDVLGERDGAPVIEIVGTETSQSQGQLRLTTVGVDADVSLLEAIGAWFSRDEAVVPRELIYPPGQSQEEVDQRNQEQFARSQSTAEVAALRHLGYPARVVVAAVLDGAPAAGRLVDGDVITAVDGVKVSSSAELQELVTERPAGTTLTVDYLRDDRAGSVELVTVTDERDGETPRIGVAVEHEMDVPFELNIDLDRIGGPSAGLMFALGIVDKLDPVDLTGGLVIAGTGSIDELGTVGAIGGIPQKLVAARAAGATAFLVPSANCAEAVRNAQPALTLVRVDTLAEALAQLAVVREGGRPATC